MRSFHNYVRIDVWQSTILHSEALFRRFHFDAFGMQVNWLIHTSSPVFEPQSCIQGLAIKNVALTWWHLCGVNPKKIPRQIVAYTAQQDCPAPPFHKYSQKHTLNSIFMQTFVVCGCSVRQTDAIIDPFLPSSGAATRHLLYKPPLQFFGSKPVTLPPSLCKNEPYLQMLPSRFVPVVYFPPPQELKSGNPGLWLLVRESVISPREHFFVIFWGGNDDFQGSSSDWNQTIHGQVFHRMSPRVGIRGGCVCNRNRGSCPSAPHQSGVCPRVRAALGAGAGEGVRFAWMMRRISERISLYIIWRLKNLLRYKMSYFGLGWCVFIIFTIGMISRCVVFASGSHSVKSKPFVGGLKLIAYPRNLLAFFNLFCFSGIFILTP